MNWGPLDLLNHFTASRRSLICTALPQCDSRVRRPAAVPFCDSTYRGRGGRDWNLVSFCAPEDSAEPS